MCLEQEANEYSYPTVRKGSPPAVFSRRGLETTFQYHHHFPPQWWEGFPHTPKTQVGSAQLDFTDSLPHTQPKWPQTVPWVGASVSVWQMYKLNTRSY